MPILAPSFSAPHIDSIPKSHPTETETNLSIMSNSDPVPETKVSRIPRVTLDVETITNTLAARLATSLLGHVLFLKSQVPFPVVQLNRIPMAKSNPRTIKSRGELLSSFDVLSSHLVSTFSSLSTAFARSAQSASTNGQGECHQAFLAFCLGPSASSSKSRVFFGLESLEAKIWGTRDDVPEEKAEESDAEDTEDEQLSEEEDVEEHADEEGDVPDESDSESDNESASDEEDSPVISRSPSPVVEKLEPEVIPVAPVMHYQSAEEDRLIKAADRLLSRTLAQAEADGSGMADELHPTQTHVMLRAPRRFAHPSWLPQQNISGMMDKALEEFLSLDEDMHKGNAKPRRAKTKVEGIWISCKEGNDPRLSQSAKEDEEDEMIWWSWDGRIIGFSDW